MAAEPIARVVADLRAARWELSLKDAPPDTKRMFSAMADQATVVDVTAIYDAYQASTEERDLYDSHPCVVPPWPTGALAYTNTYGNVYVMLYELFDSRDVAVSALGWDDGKGLDWDHDVRWVVDMFVWLGGANASGHRIPTTGPVYRFQWALGPEGQPLDLHWTITDQRFADALAAESPEDHPMMIPNVVALDACGFLQCRNVDIMEPRRRNHERKRIAKTGVTVNEIHVFPAGKTVRSRGVRGEPLGLAHTPVRGHFAEYGPKYGKGLLFGKLEGRFFIPQHARGSHETGESRQEFVLRPER